MKKKSACDCLILAHITHQHYMQMAISPSDSASGLGSAPATGSFMATSGLEELEPSAKKRVYNY